MGRHGLEQGRISTARQTVWLRLSAMAAVGVGLGVLWHLNYLLFHTVAELFSVVVGFASFVVAWYSRRWLGRNYLLLLGLGQLFVGALDVLHTVGYEGVGVINGGAGLSTQLWLGGRALDAVVLLVAVWSPQRRWQSAPVLMVLGGISALMVTGVFRGWFPVTYVPGVGVTAAKTMTELAVVLVLGVVLWRLRLRRQDFDPGIYPLLVLCVTAKVGTELSFLGYADVTGLLHLSGHLFKVAGAWLFLSAVVEPGLCRPHALIFGALERERTLSAAVIHHAATLDAVLDATVDPVLMLDRDLRIRFISRAAESFFERTSQETVARTWREAGLPQGIMAPVERLCRDVQMPGGRGRPLTEEISLPGHAKAAALEVQVSPVEDEDGLGAVVVVLRDISARKAMEDDLKASLADKNALMAEVHHRVNNNLQIVSSILQMQGWRVADPAMKVHFEQACGRILALAKAHELLYQQDSVASVDFLLYVRTLCADLFRLYGVAEGRIVVDIPPGSMPLPVNKAEPLALIVHELISNALKHAFGEGGGILRLRLHGDSRGGAVLMVSDNGDSGRKVQFDGDGASLGLRMVGVLVKQINGTITVQQHRGTEVEIRFPLANEDRPAR